MNLEIALDVAEEWQVADSGGDEHEEVGREDDDGEDHGEKESECDVVVLPVLPELVGLPALRGTE